MCAGTEAGAVEVRSKVLGDKLRGILFGEDIVGVEVETWLTAMEVGKSSHVMSEGTGKLGHINADRRHSSSSGAALPSREM